jgi:CheY-like chemotaxis protein
MELVSPLHCVIVMTSKPGSRCILVVEDEAMVRLFIVGQLREQGYAVFEAANGEDAIALLRRTPAVDQHFVH